MRTAIALACLGLGLLALAEAPGPEALRELQDRAGGDPTDPGTREAVFELAALRTAHPEQAPVRQVIAEWVVAVGLFPEDPRTLELLPRLADLQLGIGDVYGAQQAFKQEYRTRKRFVDVERAALAAHTAARAQDMKPALEWSEPFLAAEMSDTARANLYLARLKAGSALGRTEVALDALRTLELHAGESLRVDADAVMTAAALHAAVGEEEASTRLLSVAANVHLHHERRPEVLLELARRYSRSARAALATETYRILMADHPESRPAALARIDLLAPRDRPLEPGDVPAYLDVARQLPAPDLIETLCDDLFNRLVAAGYPLEAFVAVARLAGEESMAGLVVRRRAGAYLEAALELVVSRRTGMEVASLSQVALDMRLPIPAEYRSRVNDERRHMGLLPTYGAELDGALAEARDLFRQERYAQSIERIRLALDPALSPEKAPLEWRAAIGGILAEALWREGRDAEALEHLQAVLQQVGEADLGRELRVLEADLLFATDRVRACAAYARLAAGSSTRWVALQQRRCSAENPS